MQINQVEQLNHRPPPKPDNSTPFTPALLRDAIISVDGLSKSVREFPDGLHRAVAVDWILASLTLVLGLLIGLAINKQKKVV